MNYSLLVFLYIAYFFLFNSMTKLNDAQIGGKLFLCMFWVFWEIDIKTSKIIECLKRFKKGGDGGRGSFRLLAIQFLGFREELTSPRPLLVFTKSC